MASDTDWVEDVKRWYFTGRRAPGASGSFDPAGDDGSVGYEAADPALQARNWPDAPASESTAHPTGD